jgi:hypothetical protein
LKKGVVVRETLWVSHDDGPAVSGGVQGLLMVVLGVWISDEGVRERERERERERATWVYYQWNILFWRGRWR